MTKQQETIIVKKILSIMFLLAEIAGLVFLIFFKSDFLEKHFKDFLLTFSKYFLATLIIFLGLYFTGISLKQLFTSNVFQITNTQLTK